MAGFSLFQIFIFLLIILTAILQYKNTLRLPLLFYYISTFLVIFSIFAQIVLYFLSKQNLYKYFSLFSILLALDLLLIINFLNKTMDNFYLIISKRNNIKEYEKNLEDLKNSNSNEKEFKIDFNKILLKIISILLILNLIIIFLIFSFKKFSFPVNFILVIAFSFILFILLFRFFELYKEN